MLRWTEPAIGDEMINIMLSLSRESEKKYGTKTALASYSAITPTLGTLEAIVERLEWVQKATKDLAGQPGDYVRGMTDAFGCFARMLQGDQMSYGEKVRQMQQLPCREIPEARLLQLEEKISCQLAQWGYKGTCSAKIAQWLADTVIKPEQVTTVARQWVQRAKADTLRRVVGLPETDGIDAINGATQVFWSGYSRYDGDFRGTLNFNLDRPWSAPIFGNILCHEGYPGHQTFYCRWDALYQQGILPIEGAFYAYNTPTNGLFEGGPEVGLHFLDWDNPDSVTPGISEEQKTLFAVGRDVLDLQRMYQTNASYGVNVLGTSKKEALDYILKSGTASVIEAENAYRFFTDPVQATYYPSYYYGKWMVYRAYELFPEAQRQTFFKILYDTPHTTNTFIQAISEAIQGDFDPFVDC